MTTDESDVAKRVLEMMSELSKSVRTLLENQERLTAEQRKAGLAIGEAGMLLARHGEVIAELSRRAGLLDESPPPNAPPLN
jgi:hypothetical protein